MTLPTHFSNRLRPLAAGGFLVFAAAGALSAQDLAPVPEDLLEDEVFRQEVGINAFTAPSIRKIFTQLADMGAIPYEKVKREVPAVPGTDRLGVALNLGTIIADGFLAVQCERYGEMEGLGKAVLDHAELLGTGRHIKPHSKSLLEHASLQQGDELKEDLAKTQRDIEREMADLRDVDIAHLVSLGGWSRAFEVGCQSVGAAFTSEHARLIARLDIVRYYQSQLEGLHPNLQERPQVVTLRKSLAELAEKMDVPEEREIKAEELAAWSKIATTMVEAISKPAKP
ncbi:MAG: hypothetical protein ACKO2G_15455 [Verrucomicrobiales bacterium]